MSKSYWAFLKGNQNFAKLWVGQIASRLGDGIYVVALAMLVLKYMGGIGLGIVMASYSLAALLFSFLGGMIADRYSRRKLMVSSGVATGILVTLIPFLIRSEMVIITTFVPLAFLVSTATQFFEPSLDASIPNLVDEESLEKANSLYMSTRWMGMVAGPALAGILISLFSFSLAFLLDAVTFFILALIVYGIEIPQETRKMEKSILSEFREDIQDFSKFLKGESCIFVILGIALVSNLIFGPFRVVAPKLSVLLAGGSGGSGIFGLLMAMLSLGVVLGMSALGKFQFPKGKSILGGMALLGIAMIPIGIFKDIFVAVALFTVVGLGMGLVNVSVRTLLQSLTPDKLRGKRPYTHFCNGRTADRPDSRGLYCGCLRSSALFFGGRNCSLAGGHCKSFIFIP